MNHQVFSFKSAVRSHPKRTNVLVFIFFVLGPIIGIRARLLMDTNKECIEHLESGLGIVHEGLQRMEEAINRLSSILIANQENPTQENPNHDNQ